LKIGFYSGNDHISYPSSQQDHLKPLQDSSFHSLGDDFLKNELYYRKIGFSRNERNVPTEAELDSDLAVTTPPFFICKLFELSLNKKFNINILLKK